MMVIVKNLLIVREIKYKGSQYFFVFQIKCLLLHVIIKQNKAKYNNR